LQNGVQSFTQRQMDKQWPTPTCSAHIHKAPNVTIHARYKKSEISISSLSVCFFRFIENQSMYTYTEFDLQPAIIISGFVVIQCQSCP